MTPGKGAVARGTPVGGDYFTRRVDTEHLTRRLVRQLERLGQTVTLTPSTAETG